MSFSSTALQQRERESKALRLFLACSLIGSLIFHIGLLASGIGKYLLSRVPEIEDETVEITLLDTPIEEIEPEPNKIVKPKPKPEPKLEKPEPKPEIKPPTIDTNKLQPDLENTNRNPEISGGSPATSNSESIPTQRKVTPQALPVVKQPIPKPDIKPFQQFKQIEPLSPTFPVAVREKPVIPKQKPEPIAKNNIPAPPQPKPESRTAREFSTPVTPPIQPTQQNSEDLKDTLSGIRESRDNTKINSNNTAATSTDTSNIGENSNIAPRRKRRTFANNNLATGNGLGSGTGDSIGDRDGRAACVKCDKIYPAWAERQRIEGKVTVSVDTDANGNVTNVQLIDSSGNNRLDNYHQKLARKWKLKPSSNGRKGVTIITRYEL
ncbi:MAG: energy transducer TonB [Rivularia sp. (in: cyanobacteria)]